MPKGLFSSKLDELSVKLNEVFSKEQLEALAYHSGLMKRKRKLNADSFLRMLLFDHWEHKSPSLQMHCFKLEQEESVKLSKQAIDKKFNEQSIKFMEGLVELLLTRQRLKGYIPSQLLPVFNAVKVMDSTEFKLPDGYAADFPGYSDSNAAACAAIQFEYDVLSDRVHYLSLGCARQSDKAVADLRMNNIVAGDLILRDLGYYSLDSYLEIEQRQAFYISRLKSQAAIYLSPSTATPLNWTTLLSQCRSSVTGCIDQWVYIGAKQKHRVRLVAWEIPAEAARERLRKKQSKKGRLRKEDEVWSKLNVFITNIEEQVIDHRQLYELYKIRWQIELSFKTWKSILDIKSVHNMKVTRLKSYLYSKFIWILLCHEITALAQWVRWYRYGELISPYKSMSLLKSMAIKYRKTFGCSLDRLKRWLKKTISVIVNYGNKETRKNSIPLSNLLQLKPLKRQNSSIFIMALKNSHQLKSVREMLMASKNKNQRYEEKNCPCGDNRRALLFP